MKKKLPLSYRPVVVLILVVFTILFSACSQDIDKLQSKGDVKRLIRILENEDRSDREIAAQALGEIADASAVQSLSEALYDDDEGVRQSAADALINIGTPAVNPLIEALYNEDIEVRRISAKALGEIGDRRAVQPLINTMSVNVQNYLNFDEKYYRRDAAKALGKIGDPIAVQPLLEEMKEAVNEKYFREDAAEALVMIGDPAVEPLIKALQGDDGTVRMYAKEALINIGASAVEPLIETLNDDTWAVWESAENALIEIGPLAVESLIEALNSDEADIRRRAASLLGKIGDARALEPLVEMLDDEDTDLQETAALALSRIGDKSAVDSLIAHFGFDIPGGYDWITNAVREFYEPICEAFTPVVDGQGVEDAALYDAEITGPHPLVVLISDGSVSGWNDSLPLGWAPSSVSEVELVLVIEEREIKVNTQEYKGGPSISRYRYETDVQVCEARTGEVIKTKTLAGSDPGPYPYEAPITQTRIEGSRVPFYYFQLWWTEQEGVGE